MMRDMAELTKRLADVANKRFQSGDVAKLDVYKAQLAGAQAEVDASQAERRVIQRREQLNIIMDATKRQKSWCPVFPRSNFGPSTTWDCCLIWISHCRLNLNSFSPRCAIGWKSNWSNKRFLLRKQISG